MEGRIELEGDFKQVGDGLLPGDKVFQVIAFSNQFSIMGKRELLYWNAVFCFMMYAKRTNHGKQHGHGA